MYPIEQLSVSLAKLTNNSNILPNSVLMGNFNFPSITWYNGYGSIDTMPTQGRRYRGAGGAQTPPPTHFYIRGGGKAPPYFLKAGSSSMASTVSAIPTFWHFMQTLVITIIIIILITSMVHIKFEAKIPFRALNLA